MKVHPRNADSNGVDFAILVGMPVVMAILCVVVYFLGAQLQAHGGGGAPERAPAAEPATE